MNEFENRIDLTSLSETIAQIKTEVGKVIVGQEKMVDLNTVSDKPEVKISRLTQAITNNPKNAALLGQRSRL